MYYGAKQKKEKNKHKFLPLPLPVEEELEGTPECKEWVTFTRLVFVVASHFLMYATLRTIILKFMN